MQQATGQLQQESALELLRRHYLQKQTGVLELTGGSGRERLYFVVGDLYLAPGHRAVRALRRAEESPGTAGVVASVIESLAEWGQGEYAFEEGVTHISSDLAGPFPTASVVMAAAVYDSGEDQLLRALGGEECRFAAVPDRAKEVDELKLHPHEAFLLSRLESPISIRRLLGQGDLERREALERLRRLQAIDLIRPVERIPQDEAEGLLTPELIKSFSRRVRDDLDREPLELSPEEHKARVTELLHSLPELTYYDLLGLDASAPPEAIHGAYMELARMVHPSQFAVLSLQRTEGLELLFERATEAYLTLSDKDRSRRYLSLVGPQAPTGDSGPSAAERRREQEAIAQRNYLSAQELILREEYHFAMELLQQAVRVAPRAEYYALLAECAERNPKWIQKAILYYRLALKTSPGDVDLRMRLAHRLEDAGQTAGALDELETVLAHRPGYEPARTAVQRLGGRARGPGLLGWLAGLFRR